MLLYIVGYNYAFSAGVGRTGTCIALDSLFDEAEQLNKVNVFSCMSKMREARMNMVQTVVSDICEGIRSDMFSVSFVMFCFCNEEI